MSSQFRKMMATQRERELLQRNNSHGSSQNSDFDSNVSENDMISQSEGSSGKTPSEYSLPTPEDEHSQPEIDQFYFGMDTGSPVFALTNTRIKRLSDDSNADHQSLGLIKPEMLASLTTQYDFKYNRYSSVVDASQLSAFDENSEEEESEGGEEFDVDFDDDDMYSPIEIATPVSLAMPRQKPAVISIPSPRSSTFPSSGRGSLERTSLESTNSRGPVHTATHWSEEEDDTVMADTYTGQTHVFPQRISSVPTTIPPRRGSSRINSIKKLIRTTSSQLLDTKHERTASSVQPEGSTHYRVTETPRDFNIGAFITSQPASQSISGPSSPSLVIPARSTSRRHSKDFSFPTPPSLTPRNPRRNGTKYTTMPPAEAGSTVRSSIPQGMY